jgi:hypothetical protein
MHVLEFQLVLAFHLHSPSWFTMLVLALFGDRR